MSKIIDLENLLYNWKENLPSGKDLSTSAKRILSKADEIDLQNINPGEEKEIIKSFLNTTGRYDYLQALNQRDLRYKWTDLTFKMVRSINYRLLDMLENNIKNHPTRIFLNESWKGRGTGLSFERIKIRLRNIAAFLVKINSTEKPRVAIISENSVDSACCDLACLLYGIAVTPINIHFDAKTIGWILKRLNINTVYTDSNEILEKLNKITSKEKLKITAITSSDYESEFNFPIHKLGLSLAELNMNEAYQQLEKYKGYKSHESSTLLFTSGSTGVPKGVSFNQYQLVVKRFARAAALPNVGNDECLLSFLPLFHTFGRYFELLGMLYWGGTYSFLGNPSADSLLIKMPAIRPSGLISIPLRWYQIYDKCQQETEGILESSRQEEIFRKIVGDRLHWGISAAGYLDPKVFRYFQSFGVHLVSGFGMTEATGGITMTPPDDYRENSVGVPLPGMNVRLGKNSEMQLNSHYIARYLEESDIGDFVDPDEDYWLKTGDLFREIGDGHLEIVDRIKDIYKNIKGQTIAPRKVEKLFESVPGIKSTFLVGDGKAYNTLLIIPEHSDNFLDEFKNEANIREYYERIITEANLKLAPYERAVNFIVLERDFSIDKNELTAKGSFKRKEIIKNFETEISDLYKKQQIELNYENYRIIIPRWFFRDLGVLETDIVVNEKGLYNTRTKRLLPISSDTQSGDLQIGQFEYTIDGKQVDLGIMARQPVLWLGNPDLMLFASCKTGWDTPFFNFGSFVFPGKNINTVAIQADVDYNIDKLSLSNINKLIIRTLFTDGKKTLENLKELSRELLRANSQVARVIRRRISALAYHQNEDIRCEAYSVLLLDRPMPDYGEILPIFVQSGKTFLNEATINQIAKSNLSLRRLELLRKRLYSYRTTMEWKNDSRTIEQFKSVLHLLVNFVYEHRNYYSFVRSELAAWVLHDSEPLLALYADNLLREMVDWFENSLPEDKTAEVEEEWEKRIVFDDNISLEEVEVIKNVFYKTSFLQQSIILAYEEHSFVLEKVAEQGIWISHIISHQRYKRYRVSINTRNSRHYDLQLILRKDFHKQEIYETMLWTIAISGFPRNSHVIPVFGCCRTEIGAMSLVYQGGLTLWDRIRVIAGNKITDDSRCSTTSIREIFIRSIATFFRAWVTSGKLIIPGCIAPTNINVPDIKFSDNASIISLTEWSYYKSTLDIVLPVIRNFYLKTESHYPWYKQYLSYDWIFDGIIEALGVEEGLEFIKELKIDAEKLDHKLIKDDFRDKIQNYCIKRENEYYAPLLMNNAMIDYVDWEEQNPGASIQAKLDTVSQLYKIYRLSKYEEIGRIYFFFKTVFRDSHKNIKDSFNKLIESIYQKRNVPATNLVELSLLQEELETEDQRSAFSRMLFPRQERKIPLEVVAVENIDKKKIVIKSKIENIYENIFTVREPLNPSEIGKLYRLFYKEKFFKEVSVRDRFYVALDQRDRIIGGISYHEQEKFVAYVDGIVINRPLQHKGLGGSLLEDVCDRLVEKGFKVIKLNLIAESLGINHGFYLDERWGGLVRIIDEDISKL